MNNMIADNNNEKDKVLIIRMLTSAEVCAIGLPAVRYFQQQLPGSEIHFLTFGEVAQVISAAEPNIHVHTLSADQWPDDFFQAMESFLGLAEDIVKDEYSQIINLDTSFMPCFLGRFLKDAGEPVSGNYLGMSIQSLLEKVQQQTLEAEYVNITSAYLDSSFRGMYKWVTPWWESPRLPDGGYPEFYLNQCCDLNIAELQQNIQVIADKRLSQKAKSTKVIGLCLDNSEDGCQYPYTNELKKLLQQQGYEIWLISEANNQPKTILKMMAASDLVVCKANGDRWYAQAVDVPVMLITGSSEPATLMPDFATEQVSPCAKHTVQYSEMLTEALECNCDKPEDLTESIVSIFEHLEEENANG
ncbi:glycosyltransferase family 9 protein [Paraglaciecola sp.]|uniref:glycosyltransferase family 9 protein n=1 Tax=Paraglaciecola sp. TaxID=1920173 RepID=UPI003EF3E73F